MPFSPNTRHFYRLAPLLCVLWLLMPNLASAKEPIQTFAHNGTVYSVAFAPDGKHIVTGSHYGAARLFPFP